MLRKKYDDLYWAQPASGSATERTAPSYLPLVLELKNHGFYKLQNGSTHCFISIISAPSRRCGRYLANDALEVQEV
jgi:hypothetical protein